MLPDANNPVFQLAVQFVNQTVRPVFLTGNAGTGKTTFLRYIRENSFKKMAVVAPTGVAATANAVSVQLAWHANSEPDFATYTVLRSTNNGGPYEIFGRGLVTNGAACRRRSRNCSPMTHGYYGEERHRLLKARAHPAFGEAGEQASGCYLFFHLCFGFV